MSTSKEYIERIKKSNYKVFSLPEGEKEQKKYGRCAICGRVSLKRWVCSYCFREYCQNGEKPEWVEALIEIESHNQRYVDDKEVPFSALGLTPDGEKEPSENTKP